MEEPLDSKMRKARSARNSLCQQRLKSWRPLIRPGCVAWIFTGCAFFFVLLGGLILGASNGTVTVEERYDNVCGSSSTCTITLNIDEEMKAPVYFYYKLVNFYQNHRSYTNSFDIFQLQGEPDNTKQCAYDKDTEERNGIPVYPCGLVANSMFNDVFRANLTRNGNTIMLTGNNWDGSDIAWSSDEDKFKNATINPPAVSRIGTRGNTLPLPTEQDFKVWFRLAGLPRFVKLYRKIDMDLKKGDTLTVGIRNNFDTKSINGEKRVVLTTTTWLGGSNYFLGVMYVIVGSICFIYAIGMFLKTHFCPRKRGEMAFGSVG